MKTIYITLGFVIVALFQLFVPSYMIWEQEDVLLSGKVYKFKTKPIDPSDPFRGKYITLRFDINSFKTKDKVFIYGDKIKVYIKEDDEGFAKVVDVSKKKLNIKADYIIAKVTNKYDNTVTFKLPFDRFYMEESKAYDAEKAYFKVNRNNSKENVYALVYVKNGRSVLADVIIKGMSIKEYVENEHQ